MIQLRDYQVKGIDLLRDGFANGHTRQILSAATGAGKTLLVMSMIKAAIEKNKRSLFICERRVLVEQTSAVLDSMFIDHGIFMAGTPRFRPDKLVQVASIQTLERMSDWPKTDLIFIDEIHACMRQSVVAFIKSNPNTKIIGMSATPFNAKIGEHFTNVVCPVTYKELIKMGNLVPFKVFISQQIDTTGVRLSGTEWESYQLEQRALQITGNIVKDYLALSKKVYGNPVKSICFSSGVAHGTDLMREFQANGINAIQISYLDSDEFKRDVIAEFAKENTDIKMLISNSILERGFDVPAVGHVIIAKPFRRSFASHIQQIGRGARTSPGKEFCVIQDHSGNWLRFLDDYNLLCEVGVRNLSYNPNDTARKEPTIKEKEEAKCPKCFHFWPPKNTVCPNCGFVHVKKNKVITIPGELIDFEDKIKLECENRMFFFHELLQVCRANGWKEWTAYKMYESKYGALPDFPKGYRIPSLNTKNYVRSRCIAYSYAKKRAAK